MEKIKHENDLLLNNYINKKFYNLDFNNEFESTLELIIKPDCNQKCEYCYLYKNGKDIYPLEKRADNQTILSNIDMLLDYYLNNLKIKIYNIDLFAGDLFFDNLFFDIMDIFYKYFSDINKKYPEYFIPYDKKLKIIIPCNLSFIEDEKKVIKFEEYKNKLKNINCEIILSYSTDGLYSQNFREKRKLTQEWFDKTLSFCGKHGYGAHPMISPENVDNAIINYNWWIENFNKYFDITQDWSPMFLPVRNDGWTQDKINKYIEFLNYIIDYRLELFNGDIFDFSKHLTQDRNKLNNPLKTPNSDLIRLDNKSEYKTAINCSIGNNLMVNCMTLELVPCHRLAYSRLCGGKYRVEDSQIIGIESYPNIGTYISLTDNNRYYRPSCTYCSIRDFCMQGCLGAQFEKTGECFSNIKSVCNLFKQSFNFLINKYENLGVLEIILNPNFENYSPELAKKILAYIKAREIENNDK